MRFNSIVTGTGILGCAMYLASTAAFAAANTCPVTYVYVGAVTAVSPGKYGSIPIGAEVVGTYTFDRENAAVDRGTASYASHGPVGSATTSWQVGNASALGSGSASPTGYAFSSTAEVSGFMYASSAPNRPGTQMSSSFGNGTESGTFAEFFAMESLVDSNGISTKSNLTISNADKTAPPFGRFGMPELTSMSTATGEFLMLDPSDPSHLYSYVNFSVTSLTPVTAPGRCVPG